MQSPIVDDIEYADVAVLSDHAPDVPPRSRPLQLLKARLLGGFELVEAYRVVTERHVYIHLDLEQHDGSAPFPGCDTDGPPRRIPPEIGDPVLVQGNTKPGLHRNFETEVAI